MSCFNLVKQQLPEDFLRDVGISLDNFIHLVKKIKDFQTLEKKKNSLRYRGQSPSISLEDRLLLTLRYLRDYPTFFQLGKQFGISESYANKIYHNILSILINVLEFKNRKELYLKELQSIAIDVSEQPIERPVKGQKDYYSGKKKSTQLKLN